MLLSTSGTRTTPPPHTRDAAPVKSKVAPRLTAAQGVDYYSTARTVPMSLHREGHRRHMNRRPVVDTLYIIITVPRSRYTCTQCISFFTPKLLATFIIYRFFASQVIFHYQCITHKIILWTFRAKLALITMLGKALANYTPGGEHFKSAYAFKPPWQELAVS